MTNRELRNLLHDLHDRLATVSDAVDLEAARRPDGELSTGIVAILHRFAVDLRTEAEALDPRWAETQAPWPDHRPDHQYAGAGV